MVIKKENLIKILNLKLDMYNKNNLFNQMLVQ